MSNSLIKNIKVIILLLAWNQFMHKKWYFFVYLYIKNCSKQRYNFKIAIMDILLNKVLKKSKNIQAQINLDDEVI